ncbi:MAG: hypothetical protein FD131_2309 [Rhodocyclaceae bacterium]|nr:MAG: hypothetical protein FD131_2309 [Rhodocyclaceae bacterium]
MYLSSHEIARSRDRALNVLLDLSTACIDAGQRFSSLLSANSREAVHTGSRHWSHLSSGQIGTMTQIPATVWLESAARASRLLDGTLEIIGETHKAMILNAESQVRVVDEIVFATINRATKTCPWEAELPLRAVKLGLQNAELGLHDLSSAAIETVTRAEQEIHQTTEIIATSKPAPRKRAAARPKAA